MVFSKKPGNSVNIDRVRQMPLKRREFVVPAPEIARPKQVTPRLPRKDMWCVCTVETKGGEVREGVIMDVSKSGARVRFRSKCRLPNVVRIKASRIGLRRFAQIVWRQGFDIGIKFLPARVID